MAPQPIQATLPHGEHPLNQVCPDCPVIHGTTRPPQAHYARYYDEAVAVGRIDVTNAIGEAIERIDMSLRSYPDLFAHKVTAALIEARLITPDRAPALPPRQEARGKKGRGTDGRDTDRQSKPTAG